MTLHWGSFLSQAREQGHSLCKRRLSDCTWGSYFHRDGRWRKSATSCGCSAQHPQVTLPLLATRKVRLSLSNFQIDIHHVSLTIIRPVDLSLALSHARGLSLGPGAPSSPYFACSERASPCGYSHRHTDEKLQASDIQAVLCSAGSKQRAG